MIAAYRETWEMTRHILENYWRTPSLLLVVASGIVGTSYIKDVDILARTVLLVFGAGFTLYFYLFQHVSLDVLNLLMDEVDFLQKKLGIPNAPDKPSTQGIMAKINISRYLKLFTAFILLLLVALALLNIGNMLML